jgi:hypothetical protein
MNAIWLAIVPSAAACVTHHHVTAGPLRRTVIAAGSGHMGS